MPISYKTKYSWNDKLYIADDPIQQPRTLIGISLVPGGVMFTLSVAGEPVDVYEFEVTDKPNQAILLNLKNKEETDEDED